MKIAPIIISLCWLVIVFACKKEKDPVDQNEENEENEEITCAHNGDHFKVEKIYENTYSILETSKMENIYSYLLIGKEKALLFDTGLGLGNIKEVVNNLTDKKIIVVNSHSHYDHIGGNHLFDEIYALDNPFTKTNAQGITHEQLNKFYKYAYITNKNIPCPNYSIKNYTITKFIVSGEIIDLGDRTVELIATPGHSGDDLCLLDEQNKTIYLGDVFYDGWLFAHLPSSDFNQYKAASETLQKLQSKFDYFCSGHSTPMSEFTKVEKMESLFEAIIDKRSKVEPIGDFFTHKFDNTTIILKDSVYSLKKSN